MDGKHIVCLTHGSAGHVTPMYALAQKLSQYHQVTLIGYAHYVNPLADTSNPRLIVRGIPHDPNGAFSYDDTSSIDIGLKRTFAAMDAVAQQLVPKDITNSEHASRSDIPPADAVILDNLCGPAFDTCVRRKLPFYSLNTGAAYNLTLFVHLLADDIPIIPFAQAPLGSFMPTPGPDGRIREPESDTMHYNVHMPLKRTMPYSKGVIINSLREIDKDTLEQIQQQPGMDKVPLFCVGPLIPPAKNSTGGIKLEDESLLRWLSNKKARSVVYIAFGSMITPRAEQMKEIATAVMGMDRPVIWSLKKELYDILPIELLAWKADYSEGDKLVVPWAPQKLVLEHESVGVFVSHCGWNSTLEGFMAGKPFVAWPQCSDGLVNAELLVRRQVASYIKDAGLRDVRLVLAEEIREKIEKADACAVQAKELGEVIRRAAQPGGSSALDFDQLLSAI